MRRIVTAISLGVIVAGGCARHEAPVAVEPDLVESEPTLASADTALSPPAETAPAVAPAEDPEGDGPALQALHALEYRSLAPDARQLPRVVASLNADAIERAVARYGGSLLGSPGGPERVSGPIYDIEVDLFANHQRVQYYLEYFLGNSRNRFEIWLGRLNRYEGMIRRVFQAYGLPQDLVYLGLIESGYSNTAVSRARAVGMWQFMSYAGRGYGLRVDTWVDERRDPFKATDAAARLLVDLHERFGSWYVAAAAYNGGTGRVSRGLRRLPSGQDSITDETFFALYDQRYIRRETRDYVPKLIAAAIIAKEPERYGFNEVPALDPLTFDEITVVGQTGLDVLADLADTTVGALVELNPSYYRGATPPGEATVVRVPRGTGVQVLQRFAELPEDARVNFVEHVIRRGETLSLIGQRYRVSVNFLMAANPGIRPRRLRVGQRVTIPLSAAARRGEVTPLRAVTSARRRSPSGLGRRHTVRSGESLWTISQRYGTTVSRLRQLNEIQTNEIIRVGDVLLVGGVPDTHTVRRGESLWVIARRYGLRHGDIRVWNAIEEGAVLRIGQVLRLSP
ncbi:MAG: LysM peptidoglycan-binding domain-containing protein [Gemmatimonadales bacterium]